MYFKKQEIVSKLTEISYQKHNVHDLALSNLQILLNTHKKHQVVELRNNFESSVSNLKKSVSENQSVLDLLKYRCEKLVKEGVNLEKQLIKIEALKEYFLELKEKVNRQYSRGQDLISGRQRWQLVETSGKNNLSGAASEEQQSLLSSHKVTKQTKEIALSMYQNLTNQGSRLEQARMKMHSILKNINFVGNIAQMLRTRTAEDNRLIMQFSIGLIIEILFCLFIIKPWWRGE